MNLGRGLVLLAIAIVLGVLLVWAGHRPVVPVAATSGTTTAPSSTTTTEPTTTTTTSPHSSVHVTVANGTSAPTAATDYGKALATKGWVVSPPMDTTSPVTSATVVYYAPGQQANAAAVASELGLKSSAVQPVNSSIPVTPPSGTQVLVVLGPDLAGHAPSIS